MIQYSIQAVEHLQAVTAVMAQMAAVTTWLAARQQGPRGDY